MAATWEVFQKQLEITFKLKQVNNFDEFADKFTETFSNSTLGLASTTFGNTLTYGNYQLIRFGIKTYLDFNFKLDLNLPIIEESLKSLDSLKNEEAEVYEIITTTSTGERRRVRYGIPLEKKDPNDPTSPNVLKLPSDLHPILKQIIQPLVTDLNKKISQLNPLDPDSFKNLQNSLKKLKDFIAGIDLENIPYLFLEATFLIFWLTAQYTPIPPAPPTVAPLLGVSTILPGAPGILSAAFKSGFTSKDAAKAAELVTTGLRTHAKTITGIYSGLVASPAGPVPGPPIPWVGIL